MGELVGSDVERVREIRGVHAVAVAVHHLDAVPVGVDVIVVVMHRRDQLRAGVIERVAIEERLVGVVDGAEQVVVGVDDRVRDRRAALGPGERAREGRLVIEVVDLAVQGGVDTRVRPTMEPSRALTNTSSSTGVPSFWTPVTRTTYTRSILLSAA